MSDESYATYPELEERFLPPKGWRWHMFAGNNGEKLRFGTVFPKHSVPKAVIVILPGLGEYCEKYFELINHYVEKKFAIYIMEWQGQGRSYRHLRKTPQRRISNGFSKDVRDFEIFINDYVLPSSVHPEVGRLPLAMLAHSMGGNIGIRYLKQHPTVFSCAAMTAPMFGIKALRLIPAFLRVPVTKLFAEFADCSYAPGEGDYRPRNSKRKTMGTFSSDPIREKIHDTWMQFDSNLKVGGVTYRWLYYAARSCRMIRDKTFLNSIKTPIFMALAGKERSISNAAIKRASYLLPNCNLLELPESGHEILMERDEIREPFLKSFDELIKNYILDKKDSIKPF